MKKKALAILLAVMMIISCLPVSAFADEPAMTSTNATIQASTYNNGTDNDFSSVGADGQAIFTENTAGTTLTVKQNGVIRYSNHNDYNGSTVGHYVWVQINLPTDITVNSSSTITVNDNSIAYSQLDDTNNDSTVDALVYNLKIEQSDITNGSKTITVRWDNTHADTFTISLTNATLGPESTDATIARSEFTNGTWEDYRSVGADGNYIIDNPATLGKTIAVKANSSIPYAENKTTTAGNYVWVQINLPTDITVNSSSTITVNDNSIAYSQLDDTNNDSTVDALVYNLKIEQSDITAQKKEIVVKWDANHEDKFIVDLSAAGITLQTKQTVATPTISGTTPFTDNAQVTIATTTANATIYYTTDGNAPTTSSTKYTAAFTVSETTTVKAIAVKDNMTNSAVATATFTKQVSAPVAPTKLTVNAPTGAALTYTGVAQDLLSAGAAVSDPSTATIKYSTDNSTWSTTIPQKTDKGDYTVYYKAEATNNTTHTDSDVGNINVSIAAQPVTVTVKDQTILEGGSIATSADKYTITGVLNGHSATVTLSKSDSDTKIDATVVIKNGSQVDVTTNYDITVTKGNLTITTPNPGPANPSTTDATIQASTYKKDADNDFSSVGADGKTIIVEGSTPLDKSASIKAGSTISYCDNKTTPAGNYVWVQINLPTSPITVNSSSNITVNGNSIAYSQLDDTNSDNTVDALVYNLKITQADITNGTKTITVKWDATYTDTFTLTIPAGTKLENAPTNSPVTPPANPTTPSNPGNSTVLPNGSTVTTTTTAEGNKQISVTSSTGETIVSITVPANPGEGKDFDDVDDESWYKDAVALASAYGIFEGNSDNTFDPNGDMTRGMLAKVLHNLSGKSSYGVGTGEFGDVDGNAYYSDSVDWAAAAGITDGMGNGEFAPDDSITREQLATMLYRYAKAVGLSTESKADLSKFEDADQVSGYATEAMQWAVAAGFIRGRSTSDGALLLAPKGNATRAEVATVLTRLVASL